MLDTNVYFSAFTHRGLPFWIWQKAIERTYILVASPPIVAELGDVLRRKAAWRDQQVLGALKLIVKVVELVSPTMTLHEVPDDEDDNRILECAVAGRADLIVTADRHLRRLKTFGGIGIIAPIDFRRMFE